MGKDLCEGNRVIKTARLIIRRVRADDWKAIQETIYLNSIPGMAESIREGGETPIEECVPEDEVDW